MKKYKKNILLTVILSMLLPCLNTAFSQGNAPAGQSEASAAQNSQWAMGEVVNVDPVANKFDLKQYDFDTETEKTITITVTAQTNYVNALALSDLKSGDVVSVDYRVGPQGNNIADNVSLEKEQDNEVALPSLPPEAPAGNQTQQPEATTPVQESPGISNTTPPDKGFIPSPGNTGQNQ